MAPCASCAAMNATCTRSPLAVPHSESASLATSLLRLRLYGHVRAMCTAYPGSRADRSRSLGYLLQRLAWQEGASAVRTLYMWLIAILPFPVQK